MPVDRLEMHEIQIAGRECFVGPGVTYFRFERVELVRVGKVELVFQDSGSGIAGVIGDSIVLAVGLDDRFLALFGGARLACRDRSTALSSSRNRCPPRN